MGRTAAALALWCLLLPFAWTAPALDITALTEQAQKLPRLESLLVYHRGELLLEQYLHGTDPRRPANMKSASKSVMSALIGIALERGLIPSLDTPVVKLLPGYLEDTELAAKSAITLEDLLTMRSGLETTSNRNYGRWVLSEDWVKFVLKQPLVAEPGTKMLYSIGSSHLLSAILTRASGTDSKQFAEQHLSTHLGFPMNYWSQDPQGIYFGGNDMEMTPLQMLRFGLLYLNDGRYNGQQVLSTSWVQESFRPRARSPRGQGRYYGYGWWLRDLAGMQVPVAWGYGGQLIFVVQELDLVVVATSDSRPSPARRGHLRELYRLVEQEVMLPLRRDQSHTASLAD